MPPPKLPSFPDAARRAREQATEYDSLFQPTTLELDNGDTIEIPPHPNLQLIDDDRLEAYEELLFEVESYDREEDVYIPEQTLASGVVLPAETRRGATKIPYRKDGQLIKPPHRVQIVKAVLGDEEYARLTAGGKSSADVWRIWNKQGLELAERQRIDSKSNGSGVPVEKLSE